MDSYRYVYGPVPSRRMGISLGVSPIPIKCCNYSCVYCQLGRTSLFGNERREFFLLSNILDEVRSYVPKLGKFDVATIVGEGEPTLYARLGELVAEVRSITGKPVAVITNGALLSDAQVRRELLAADLVLPSLDAYDDASFRRIHRPCPGISFDAVSEGLAVFSREYAGELWIETMLVRGINDDDESLGKLRRMLDDVRHDRVFVNIPVRPPAEDWVLPPKPETIRKAIDALRGASMETLASSGFASGEPDDLEAILSIIRRHPMNEFEITGFLESRGTADPEGTLRALADIPGIESVERNGRRTFRFRSGKADPR